MMYKIMLVTEQRYVTLNAKDILDADKDTLRNTLDALSSRNPTKFSSKGESICTALLDRPYTVMVASSNAVNYYLVILSNIPITTKVLIDYYRFASAFNDRGGDVTWRTLVTAKRYARSWPTVKELITPTDATAVAKLTNAFNKIPVDKRICPTTTVQYYDVPIPVMLATMPTDVLSALRKLQQVVYDPEYQINIDVDAVLRKYKSALYFDYAGDIGGTLKSVTFELDETVPKVTYIPVDTINNVVEYLRQMYPQCGIAARVATAKNYVRMYEYNGQCLILSD